mgnify:CR=1 FL=1
MGRGVKKHPTLICRCNDVTIEDVEKAIEEGYTDIESLRKRLRIGMGPCQGRTCIPLLIRVLARKLGKKPAELLLPTVRPPIVPVPLELFLKSKDVGGGE